MRLFRLHRREAMELWRSGLTHESRWSAEPAHKHAPDLDPSEVGIPERVGMLGRPLPKSKGAITGLEGGSGLPPSQHHHGN
jgi:hypothetical protein